MIKPKKIFKEKKLQKMFNTINLHNDTKGNNMSSCIPYVQKMRKLPLKLPAEVISEDWVG